jgi:hypothetical protein
VTLSVQLQEFTVSPTTARLAARPSVFGHAVHRCAVRVQHYITKRTMDMNQCKLLHLHVSVWLLESEEHRASNSASCFPYGLVAKGSWLLESEEHRAPNSASCFPYGLVAKGSWQQESEEHRTSNSASCSPSKSKSCRSPASPHLQYFDAMYSSVATGVDG